MTISGNWTDTTPPVLSLPTTISTQATSSSGAAVTYTATATDNVDGSVPVTCTPSSGSTFPLAVTTVNCWSSDSADNTSNGSFTVTVTVAPRDSVPPTTTVILNPSSPNGSNGWYTSNVHVALSAADENGGTGVAETRCVLDPASPPASFSAIPSGCIYSGAGADVTTEGQHVLYAASSDGAGNLETVVNAAFKIDKTPPSLTVTGVSAPADGFMPAQSFTVFPATVGAQPIGLSGSASDIVSGLASLTVNGNPVSIPSGTGTRPGA